MPRVFISYRRDDSRHVTGRIYDRLAQVLGEKQVFKDVDSIPLGVDFRQVLGEQVGSCDAVLAIIGDRWLTATDAEGKRRLDDEADFVRLEIETALKRSIPVIPVLIGDQKMPTAAQLPASLAGLAYRNGTTLRDDPFFRTDVERLVRAIAELGPPAARHSAPPERVVNAELVPEAPTGSPFAQQGLSTQGRCDKKPRDAWSAAPGWLTGLVSFAWIGGLAGLALLWPTVEKLYPKYATTPYFLGYMAVGLVVLTAIAGGIVKAYTGLPLSRDR
jgi:hypothetical protein